MIGSSPLGSNKRLQRYLSTRHHTEGVPGQPEMDSLQFSPFNSDF
jgi:hypothetical protein